MKVFIVDNFHFIRIDMNINSIYLDELTTKQIYGRNNTSSIFANENSITKNFPRRFMIMNAYHQNSI